MPAEDDLYAGAEDVPAVRHEVALLRARLEEVVHGTQRPRTVEEHRPETETR
ncbi:hypothetical protein ACFXKY_34590 [Streptomyces canus]|uniref:hypothetical protein n=1 Tax=Streptomyces canus TaxID=58343 RepID=UPI0036AFEC7F